VTAEIETTCLKIDSQKLGREGSHSLNRSGPVLLAVLGVAAVASGVRILTRDGVHSDVRAPKWNPITGFATKRGVMRMVGWQTLRVGLLMIASAFVWSVQGGRW